MEYFNFFLTASRTSSATTTITIMVRSVDIGMTDNFFVYYFFGFLYMNAYSRRVA